MTKGVGQKKKRGIYSCRQTGGSRGNELLYPVEWARAMQTTTRASKKLAVMM